MKPRLDTCGRTAPCATCAMERGDIPATTWANGDPGKPDTDSPAWAKIKESA